MDFAYDKTLEFGSDAYFNTEFLKKNAEIAKTNPIGWINTLFQDRDLLRANNLSSKITEVCKRVYLKDSMEFKFVLYLEYDGRGRRFIGQALKDTEAKKIAYYKAVAFLRRRMSDMSIVDHVSGLPLNKATQVYEEEVIADVLKELVIADAQMDSAQATEVGLETLEGEKSFGTIMTTAVSKVSTLPAFDPHSQTIKMTKLATGEEISDFNVLQSRWTKLKTFEWNTSNSVQGQLIYKAYLPEEIYKNASAPNRLPFEQFVYTRPNYEIKVKINGHKFAQGRLLCTYYYEPGTTGHDPQEGSYPDETTGPWFWQNGVLRHHAYIDLAESNEVCIEIPFRNKSVWINTLPNSGTSLQGAINVAFMIYQVSPIRVGDGAPNSFPITVYARLHDTQFTGIRNNKPVDTQMGQGASQTFMDVSKVFMSGVGAIPLVGPVVNKTANLLGEAALTVAKPLASPGYIKDFEKRLRYIGIVKNRDKPILNEQPREFRPNPVGNIAIATEVEPCLSMRLDPTATCCLPPELDLQLASDSVLELLGMWNYFNKFSWSMASHAGDELFTTPGTPYDQLQIKNKETVGTTLLDGIMQFYGYYAGGIEYRFDLVATQFHNGILVVTWVPWAVDYTMEQGMSSYFKIFDLREDKSFTFSIPYINNTVLRNSPYQSYYRGYGIQPFNPGQVKVWIQNPLVPIQSVATEVEILVYKRVLPDFQVSYLKKHSYDSAKNYVYDPNLLALDGTYPITKSKPDPSKRQITLDTYENKVDKGVDVVVRVTNIPTFKELTATTNNWKIATAEVKSNTQIVISAKGVGLARIKIDSKAGDANPAEFALEVVEPEDPSKISVSMDTRTLVCKEAETIEFRQIYNWSSIVNPSVGGLPENPAWIEATLDDGMIKFVMHGDKVPEGSRGYCYINGDNVHSSPTLNFVNNYPHQSFMADSQQDRPWVIVSPPRRISADAQMEGADSGDKETYDTTPEFGKISPYAQVLQVGEDHAKISNIMKRYIWVDEQKSKPLKSGEKNTGYHLIPFTVMPWQYYSRGTAITSLQSYIARQFRWGRGSLRLMILISNNSDKDVIFTHVPQNSISKMNERGNDYVYTPFLNGNSHASQYMNTKINSTIKLEIPFHGIYNYLDMQAGLQNNTVTKSLPSYMDLIAVNLGQIYMLSPGEFRARVWLSAGDDWTFHQLSPIALHYNYLSAQDVNITPDHDLSFHQKKWEVALFRSGLHMMNSTIQEETEADTQMERETFPDDATLGIVGATDVELPLTRLQGFSSRATQCVTRALDSVVTPIKHAVNLPRRITNTFQIYEKLGMKVDAAYESLKDMAQSIVDMVSQKCSWVVGNMSNIFSTIIHFLQTLVNPTWQTFVLSFLGMLSSLQLFTQDVMSKLTDFFLRVKPRASTEEQQTGGASADAQCEHNTCVRCRNREECMITCKYCRGLERDYMFSEEEAGTLIAILMGGLSAYWQYKATPIDTSFAMKALRVSSTFWMTAKGAVMFFKIIVRLICRLVAKMQDNMPDVVAAKTVTQGAEGLAAFVKEANLMMDQRNLVAMQTDPQVKFRFWSCVAKAYQLQVVLAEQDLPNKQIIMRIVKQIIDIGNKESVHAMSCPVRYEPYVICFEGATKIGKSFLAQHVLPKIVADESTYNVKTYDNPIFVRTPGVEYWNGYRNQPIILYDDYLAVNSPEFAPLQTAELFNLKSCAIMNLNMAHLDEKSLRANPFVVGLCTNNAKVHINGLTDPDAFLRRRDAVWRVELKPEYKSIDEVPADVKKKFGHLQFKRYDKPTKDGVLMPPLVYDAWMEQVKKEMGEYHRKEVLNVKARMEALSIMLPRAARVMMTEVDPYHIFYSAYTHAVEDLGTVQTGWLPSEVIANQLALATAMLPEEAPIPDPNQPDPPPQADAQIDFRGIWQRIKSAIHSKLFYRCQGPMPRWIVTEWPVEECPICKEEKEMKFTCINGHRICGDCKDNLDAVARRGNGHGIGCQVCRDVEMFDIRLEPDYYAEHFIGVLYWAKAKQYTRNLTSAVSNFTSQVQNNPYFSNSITMAISVLGTLTGVSIMSLMVANAEVAMDNEQMLDRLAWAPWANMWVSRVRNWGPFFYVSEECETQRERMDRIRAWHDNLGYELGRPYQQYPHHPHGGLSVDAQMPTPEEWSHLTEPICKDLVRGPRDIPEFIVADLVCPHKNLSARDSVYCTEFGMWLPSCMHILDSDYVPDGPCQHMDCPWQDMYKRHDFLNSWAHHHATTIAEHRRQFNRSAQWRIPKEFLPESADGENTRRMDVVRQQIVGAVKGKSWTDYLPRWDAWKKIIKVALVIVGGISACVATCAFFNWCRGNKEDAQLVSSGSMPMKRLPHKNVQVKGVAQFGTDKYEATVRAIERNSACFAVKYRVGEVVESRHLRMLGLFGRMAVMPKHFGMWLETWLSRVRRGDYTEGAIILQSYKNPGIQIPWEMERGKLKFTDNDLCFVELPKTFPLFKDLTSFITPAKQHALVAGEFRHVEVDFKDMRTREKDSYVRGRAATLTLRGTADYEKSEAYNVYESTYGRQGACGAVYVSRLDQPIFAMHVAGDNLNCDVGYGVALIREDVEALKEKHVAFQVWYPQLKDPSDAQMALPGCILPIGTLPQDQMAFCPTKTKIVPSLLQGKIEGIEPKTFPGILSAQDERYEYNRSPLYWGCMKHTRPAMDFPAKIFEMAAEGVESDILAEALPLRDVSQTLTLEEAITGFNELPHYDQLNLTTSAGWPWNLDNQRKTKEGWIKVERDIHSTVTNVEIHPKLRETMELKDEQRLRGIKPITAFLDWLKDERRKENKLKLADGTRIFSLSPIDFSIQQRQMFLDFSASFTFYRQRMEHAVGITADGPEWSNLAYQMNNKSKTVFDGDYKDFGPRLLAMVVHKAYDIMINWYIKNGDISEANIMRRKMMAEEVANCVHVVRDFMYEGLCGSPSGSTLTTIVNTICSILYVRFCWFYVFWGTDKATHQAYKENVLLKAYGDDMFAAVKDEVKEEFNTLVVGNVLKKFDIVFTDASKQGLVKYQTLEETSFLKRGFRKHPDREGQWLAPLDKLSVFECAQWVWKSHDIREATAQNAEQSLMLAYGHGRDFFNEWKALLNAALDDIGLPRLALTWDYIDDMHFGASEVEQGQLRSEGLVAGPYVSADPSHDIDDRVVSGLVHLGLYETEV